MKELKLIIVFLVIILVFFACTSVNIDTPAKKYYTVRVQFNDLIEQYLPYQSKIDSDAREKIQTAIKEVDLALDIWGKHVSDENYNYSADLELWLALKTEIVRILTEVAK